MCLSVHHAPCPNLDEDHRQGQGNVATLSGAPAEQQQDQDHDNADCKTDDAGKEDERIRG